MGRLGYYLQSYGPLQKLLTFSCEHNNWSKPEQNLMKLGMQRYGDDIWDELDNGANLVISYRVMALYRNCLFFLVTQ